MECAGVAWRDEVSLSSLYMEENRLKDSIGGCLRSPNFKYLTPSYVTGVPILMVLLSTEREDGCC